jgi:hypothetical protein
MPISYQRRIGNLVKGLTCLKITLRILGIHGIQERRGSR